MPKVSERVRSQDAAYMPTRHVRICVNPRRRENVVAVLRKIDQDRPRPTQLLRALTTLLRGGVRVEELPLFMDGAAPGELAHLFYLVDQFDSSAMLIRTIEDDQGYRLATVEPMVLNRRREEIVRLENASVVALSPYSFVRPDAGEFLIEAALGSARIRIHDPVCLSLYGLLREPISVADIAARLEGRLHGACGRSLLDMFSLAGIVEISEKNSLSARAAAQGWEFHDLVFHGRSREGWTSNPCGATFRFWGQTEPSPALKSPPDGDGIVLPLPGAVTNPDRFLEVLESRRSVRAGTRAPSIEELSALLYYAARVRDLSTPQDGHQITRRPYPNAGAAYELEIYPVIGCCSGVEPGIYYFDPHAFRLFRVGTNAMVPSLLEDARVASGASSSPDIQLVITARFRRLAWKYESIAYALILKNAGVLLQTLSLTATALDLAACPLGNGDGRKFCLAAGLEYIEESPIAELILCGPAKPKQ
jgi:oxazoline/thiazoline dehydrogenase